MSKAVRRSLFTSPRARGEVGSLAIRVRGSLRELLSQLSVPIEAPHPNPLPVRTGRGNRSVLTEDVMTVPSQCGYAPLLLCMGLFSGFLDDAPLGWRRL
jgi:hypothetical protein